MTTPTHVWLTEPDAYYHQMVNAADFNPEKGYLVAWNDLSEEQKQKITNPPPKMYTREEVQKWRDDVAHAAADIVQRVSPSFGDGDWSWLVDAIRGLAKNPQGDERAAFEAWAAEDLGQDYSLEMEEGVYVDRVTRWAFVAWKAGRNQLREL